MKMTRTILLAVAAIATVSCVKEQALDNNAMTNPNLVETTLTVGAESGDTKAAFSEQEYPKIVWQGNEEISVLGANTGNQKFTTTSTGDKAEFSGLADLTDEVLYAVYPYDAAAELTADGKISKVTVPAVQTATAGSFDPKAYIAVAKSTNKNLTFKAVGGFVRFQLEDATNVKSVTMVSNAGANMACTGTANLKNDGSVAHESPYVNASESVKLVGTFETGKDYFMVVRPQPYTGGVTLYIEYTDGTVLSRKGESALFESGKGRNYIRNLGTLKKTDFTKVDGLYVLYNMGYDITVGDLTVNKETHPTASIVDITEANKDMTANFKTGGVYFINQNENCSFTIAGYVDVAKDLIIISNNPSKKVNYNHSASHYFNLANCTFAMKGVSVNLGSKYLINNSKCTTNSGKIIFDDCSVSNVAASLYYGSKSAIGISLFQFNKCDIVTASNIQLLNLNKTTVMNDYSNIKFNDCTFSAPSMASFVLVNSASATQTGTAPTSALEVKNCTFHNLRPNPSFINVPWCGNLKFNKNLVSIYSLTSDGTMVSANTDSGNLSLIDASDNYYYVKNFSGKTLKAKSSDSQSVTSENAYMFNTETLVVKTEYAGYGATR